MSCSAAGGGGERVLWCAIAALSGVRDVKHLKIVIYCADQRKTDEEILEHACSTFDVEIPKDLDVEFVRLRSAHLLEPQR